MGANKWLYASIVQIGHRATAYTGCGWFERNFYNCIVVLLIFSSLSGYAMRKVLFLNEQLCFKIKYKRLNGLYKNSKEK